MKNRTIFGQGTLTLTYRNGKPPLITRRTSTVDKLWSSASVSGDHVTPTAFSFNKSFGTGLSGQCTDTDPKSLLDKEVGYYASAFSNTEEPFGYKTGSPNLAYERALGDVISALRGDLDVSIDLFQIRKTRDGLKRLASLSYTFKKSMNDIRNGRSATKEVASYYLEWTYGLQPTAQTAYDLVDKLLQDAKSGAPLFHYRGRGQSVSEYRTTEQTTLMGYQALKVPVTGTRSVRCQLDIYVRANFNRLQKLSQYTSLNPASWAYENLPYSFVVDWFWNFSQFLRALETAMLFRNTFKTGCKTVTVRNDASCSCSGVIGTISYNLIGNHIYKSYERTVLSTFPTTTWPVINNGLGWRRIANAAALLSQFLPDSKSDSRKTKVPVFRGK